MLGYTLAYYSDDTDLSWEIYLLRIQRLMGITTRVRPRVSGDEEGGGWAEDEAVSTFKRSAWHDCQLGEYFSCVLLVPLVVFDPLMVVFDSWWMNWKGGGWWRHCGQWRMGPASSLLGKNSTKSIFQLCFQKLEGSEYKFSEAVKLDSYVNIISTGPPNVYYVGGKSGYLAKLSKS